ncbi:hypothetical protein [Virgibacillus sp. SK37]|uniref:hypothetical protein n=1 Tax=Virgibacillus sp. SK37 TaxID=403957 RepID=UPI0004D14BED|nr:hypothetical protein [Virgibacillus sp. SK37]AIF45547.1 hypothetical protein X953_16255 [Virgibacillus sp. SK37]
MGSNHYIELIQNTFSTLLLDAIQYFPEDIENIHYEASGILYGTSNKKHVECDYVFPVGIVEKRSKESVTSNPKLENALTTSRQLFSTSQFIGTYHSHPYEKEFPDWANPSNGDVNYSRHMKYPYEVIVAITRNAEKAKPLTLNGK